MKTVIEMAREAGFSDHEAFDGFECTTTELLKFAALVRDDEREQLSAHLMDYNQGFVDGVEEGRAGIEAAVLAEREACAKVCDEMFSHAFAEDEYDAALKCAAAIRARGDK